MATKRTKTDYENAAKTSHSIAGMCRYFGLKPCGGNYKIMHKAIKEFMDACNIPGVDPTLIHRHANRIRLILLILRCNTPVSVVRL